MRSILLSSLAIVVTTALSMPVVLAQSYPVKPIRIIFPYTTAGGLGDLAPRAIGAGLTELLGQQGPVENRPGASQEIGMRFVAKSPTDG